MAPVAEEQITGHEQQAKPPKPRATCFDFSLFDTSDESHLSITDSDPAGQTPRQRLLDQFSLQHVKITWYIPSAWRDLVAAKSTRVIYQASGWKCYLRWTLGHVASCFLIAVVVLGNSAMIALAVLR
jgi:hypothetical protein